MELGDLMAEQESSMDRGGRGSGDDNNADESNSNDEETSRQDDKRCSRGRRE